MKHKNNSPDRNLKPSRGDFAVFGAMAFGFAIAAVKASPDVGTLLGVATGFWLAVFALCLVFWQLSKKGAIIWHKGRKK